MMTKLRKSIIVLMLAISGVVMIIVFIGLLFVGVGSKLFLPSLAGLGFLLICAAMFANADIITFDPHFDE